MPDRLPANGLAALLCCCAVLLGPAVEAAEPDWPQRSVTLEAQEQPLGEFLRALFGAAGLRAEPSSAIGGRISGRFDDTPAKIFENVVKAYDLLPYYDGTTMHVVTAAEAQSKSIRARPAEFEQIERALSASKLADRYQSVELARTEGMIKLRGAPEFIADMQQLIAAQRRPAPAPAAPAPPEPQVERTPDTLVFRTFALKYASAADQTFYQNGQEIRIPGVVTLLRSMTGIGGSLIATSGTQPSPTGRNVPSVRGEGLRRYDRGREQPAQPAPPAEQQAAGIVSDRASAARIEPDPNLNTVLIRDYEDAMPMYRDLIAQLDKQPQLVEIQVTIVDIDRSKLNDLGVDWRYEDRNNSISAGGGDAGEQNGGLLLNTVLGDAGQFLARVNALAQSGSAQVVSRPQVLTLSNLEAVLATDQSFFVRVAGNEDVDLFDVSVGTSLRVVPSVAGDAGDPQIRLRVAIEDGSLSPDAVVDDIPIVDRSTLNTQAVIFDGQSLLLGGLVRDTSSKNTTKVPLLGDIPGVGRLFKRTTDVTSSQERLFLISPRIVATNRPAAVGPTPPAQPAAPQPAGSQRAGVTTAAAPAAPPRRDSQSTSQPSRAYLDGF